MSAGVKRAVSYGIGIVVGVALLAWILIPVGPQRIEYPSTSGGRPSIETYYLTKTPITAGKVNCDIAPTGVTAARAATFTFADGAWTVRAEDASPAVTVNGGPSDGVALQDGAVVMVGPAKIPYFAGRGGFLGFLDRIESDQVAHLFMSPTVISKAFPIIAAAFPVSVAFGVLGFILAIPLGLSLAFMKMARTRWLRWPATAYVDVVRGTPLFLQILVVMFLIPLLPFYKSLLIAAPWLNDAGPLGVSGSYWVRGLIVLSFNSAAYMAEIFRAGIQSISKGQSEAARSLGMTAVQSMAFVILPQTVRRILPTMMSEFILLFKDTAMLSAVGVAEMVLRAREVAASRFNASSYIVAAMFYLLLTIPLGRFVQSLENRLAVSEGAGGHEGKREPMVPVPIDSEHLVAHSELLPGVTPDPLFHHDRDGRR